jgi:hypothetical protein
VRIAVKLLYIVEFNEPAEEEWASIITILQSRLGLWRKTMQSLFEKCRDRINNPEKVEEGRGIERKLDRKNEGLIAGAAALNNLVSPTMATYICNEVNRKKYPNDHDKQVCRNTLLDTLKSYTDNDMSCIQRRKPGSKDKNSKWAIARLVMAKQMKHQQELGEQVDWGETSYAEVIQKYGYPPTFKDGTNLSDENPTGNWWGWTRRIEQ